MLHSTTVADDHSLHRAVVAGDDLAMTTLYRRYHLMVERTCTAVLGDRDLAQDAAQEVFAAYLSRPERLDLERGTVASYLKTMARRRAVDLIRVRERSTRRHDRLLTLVRPAEPDEDHNLNRMLTSLDLWPAVRALPQSQRTAVAEAFVHDRSYRETAAVLGIAEGTAKSRIRLALTRLQTDRSLATAA